MDRPTLYIETSVVSYLASRPSRDPVTLRNQQLTHTWWNTRRHKYALFTSQTVLDEAAAGDPQMALARLSLLSSLPILRIHAEALALAEALRLRIPLPPQAAEDAVHIALGAHHGMAYLLTWDSKHIANPRLRSRIEQICLSRGLRVPRLCTPGEMLGE
jgi:predicted nucleic acid-binding protein